MQQGWKKESWKFSVPYSTTCFYGGDPFVEISTRKPRRHAVNSRRIDRILQPNQAWNLFWESPKPVEPKDINLIPIGKSEHLTADLADRQVPGQIYTRGGGATERGNGGHLISRNSKNAPRHGGWTSPPPHCVGWRWSPQVSMETAPGKIGEGFSDIAASFANLRAKEPIHQS